MRKWTPARVRGLRLLAEPAVDGVRYSNETSDGPTPCIYWQTAGWLERQGYATIKRSSTFEVVVITAAGLAALSEARS